MDTEFKQLQAHGDEHGSLVAMEQENNIPFEIKRVYYIFKTLEDIRHGCRMHYQLEQIAIAVYSALRLITAKGM